MRGYLLPLEELPELPRERLKASLFALSIEGSTRHFAWLPSDMPNQSPDVEFVAELYHARL